MLDLTLVSNYVNLRAICGQFAWAMVVAKAAPELFCPCIRMIRGFRVSPPPGYDFLGLDIF